MKKIPYLGALLALLSFGGLVLPEGALAKTSPAQTISQKKNGKKSSALPLRGKSYYAYGRRKQKGYYSYRYADGIDTRKFTDPTLNGQNAFGPLESDFFFSTPRPPIGGDSPYMH